MADINAVAQQFTDFYYQSFDTNRSSLAPLYVLASPSPFRIVVRPRHPALTLIRFCFFVFLRSATRPCSRSRGPRPKA